MKSGCTGALKPGKPINAQPLNAATPGLGTSVSYLSASTQPKAQASWAAASLDLQLLRFAHLLREGLSPLGLLRARQANVRGQVMRVEHCDAGKEEGTEVKASAGLSLIIIVKGCRRHSAAESGLLLGYKAHSAVEVEHELARRREGDTS